MFLMYVLTHNFKTNMDKIAFLSTKPTAQKEPGKGSFWAVAEAER